MNPTLENLVYKGKDGVSGLPLLYMILQPMSSLQRICQSGTPATIGNTKFIWTEAYERRDHLFRTDTETSRGKRLQGSKSGTAHLFTLFRATAGDIEFKGRETSTNVFPSGKFHIFWPIRAGYGIHFCKCILLPCYKVPLLRLVLSSCLCLQRVNSSTFPRRHIP